MNLLFNTIEEFFAVLVTGILLGAGLPALYAVGIRVLAWSAGAGRDNTVDSPGPQHPAGRWGAYAIFTVVFVIIALGLGTIIATGLGLI